MILIVSAAFPPYGGASGFRLAELVTRLAAFGWPVTVVAAGGNSPEGPLPPGVTVIRVGAASPSPGGRRGRLAPGNLLLMLRLALRGLMLPRHDVVMTLTTPPLLALVTPLLAWRHRAAAVHWCHDLYPHLFPVLGIVMSGATLKVLRHLAWRALGRHHAIVAIGSCMAERLAKEGIDPDRVAVVENWADPTIRPVDRIENAFRRHHRLGERFIVAYSGNFGLAHSFDALVAAAEHVGRRQPDVLFLLIGGGRRHAAVARAIAHRRLTNVRLLPFVGPERISESLGAADLHLATMRDAACGLMVPSKVMASFAARRPCLFVGPGDCAAARAITAFGCGAVHGEDDVDGIVGSVLRYARDRTLWNDHAERAGRAARFYTAEAAATRFLSVIDRAMIVAGRIRSVRSGGSVTALARVVGSRSGDLA